MLDEEDKMGAAFSFWGNNDGNKGTIALLDDVNTLLFMNAHPCLTFNEWVISNPKAFFLGCSNDEGEVSCELRLWD